VIVSRDHGVARRAARVEQIRIYFFCCYITKQIHTMHDITTKDLKAEQAYVETWSKKYVTAWACPMITLGLTIYFGLRLHQQKLKGVPQFLMILMIASLLTAVGVQLYVASELVINNGGHASISPEAAMKLKNIIAARKKAMADAAAADAAAAGGDSGANRMMSAAARQRQQHQHYQHQQQQQQQHRG